MKTANPVWCKALGSSDTKIPEIGLGTWDFHAGPDVLRAGLDAGALFIDTAESYGTEPVVAEAIKSRRGEVFVASKVSPEHFRRADLLKAADASLARLRTDYLDLYQLHHPNDSVPIEETVGALEALVDAGKVRHIGVSNFSVAQLRRAQAAMRKHRIVSNQIRLNLADRTALTEVLPWCQANGITVIAYSPLAREFQRIHDSDPKGTLAALARETGRTPAQVALNWCLCLDGVVVIPKSNNAARIVENCSASGWRLSTEQVQRLNQNILFRRRGVLDRTLRRCLGGTPMRVIKGILPLLPKSIRRRIS
jgi:diketogulonate reductase-like aldo/keto reductase